MSRKNNINSYTLAGEKGRAIKIKVGANKLCGKVSDNKKKVKSFVPFFLAVSPYPLRVLGKERREMLSYV